MLRRQTAAAGKRPDPHGTTVDAGAGGDLRAIPISGHIGLVENFMAALRGEQDLRVDGRQGMRSVAPVETIYAATGLQSIG